MIKWILLVFLIGFQFCAKCQRSGTDSLDVPSISLGYNLTDFFSGYSTNTATIDVKLIDNVLLTAEIGFTRSFDFLRNGSGRINYRVLFGTEYVAIKRPKGFAYVGLYLNALQTEFVRKESKDYVNFVRTYSVLQSKYHVGIKSRIGHTWHNKYFSLSLGYDYEVGLAREFSRHLRRKNDYVEHPLNYTITSNRIWNLYGKGSLHINIALPFYIKGFAIFPKATTKKRGTNGRKRKRGNKRKRSRRR